jgi:hypothetical protein
MLRITLSFGLVALAGWPSAVHKHMLYLSLIKEGKLLIALFIQNQNTPVLYVICSRLTLRLELLKQGTSPNVLVLRQWHTLKHLYVPARSRKHVKWLGIAACQSSCGHKPGLVYI